MEQDRFLIATKELEQLKKNRIVNFFRIRKLALELQELTKELTAKKAAELVEKTRKNLQHKGLFFQGTIAEASHAFIATLAHMRAIGCKKAFTYIFDSGLKLLLFSDDELLSCHAVEAVSALDALKTHGRLVSLTQLQEVAGWLHNHGVAHTPLIDRASIEKKLVCLMQSCPHGAYVLHAHNATLTLSRLSPVGKVEHLLIDLQHEVGCYTMELDGVAVSATRIQFKKKLEQMGTPLRLVSK